MQEKIRNYSLNILLFLGSIIFTLIILEVALHFSPLANLPKKLYSFPANYFQADLEIDYDIIPSLKGKVHNLPEHPYEVFSNQYGCFDYEREVPDDYGIVLGDSMTWGFSPLDAMWTSQVEKMSGQFLLKCGLPGYGTFQELQKAKKVINKVGKPPSYIIVLYTENDFNDDYYLPHRTIYHGHFVSLIKNTNLDTGEVFRRTDEEISQRYGKYNEDTFSNTLRNLRYELVLYRLYRTYKKQYRGRFKEFLNSLVAIKDAEANEGRIKLFNAQTLPRGMAGPSGYAVVFARYLDADNREWFSNAFKSHAKNMLNFASYANEIGAKLLFIDTNGVMPHKRYDPVKKQFKEHNVYYYNLKADYTNFVRWKYDAHWNIEGNKIAADHIFNYISSSNFFSKNKDR